VKRVLAIFLTAVLLCGILPLTVSAESVDITADFTDPNFRAMVYEHIDKTAPEPIYDTDVAGITYLYVSGEWDNDTGSPIVGAIKNLAGLEYFTGLKELCCAANQLASLPPLPNSLEFLDCSWSQLTSLPELPSSLKALHCQANSLASLPLLLPNSLEILDCGGNKLTSLPTLPNGLKRFYCYDNKLTSLPKLPSSLESLDCHTNNLASLPELPSSLKILECNHNQLTALDVTDLPLNYLDCSYNKMTSKSDVIGFTGTWDGVNFRFDPQNLSPPAPPSKTIFSTAYESSFWNWIKFIFLFGWIWMWF